MVFFENFLITASERRHITRMPTNFATDFFRVVRLTSFRWLLAGAALCAPASAADHADAPNTSNDPSADLNDSYIFLDPTDNSFLVLLMTVRGFIVPGEAVNQGIFDPGVLYRFQIENTGDPKPDLNIDVTFSARLVSTQAQIGTVVLPDKKSLSAPATNPSLSTTAPQPVVTVDASTGISFFAGEVDDPFFFDIPAFSRYVASVRAGAPDRTQFNRGRDSCAGYNTMAIGLRIPLARLKTAKTNLIGLNVLTYRRAPVVSPKGKVTLTGPYYQVDRAATPAVNVALIPFANKNAFNASNPTEDATAKFANDIVDTLVLLGADDAHISKLANGAVFRGDYIRVNVTIPNYGPGGGTNKEAVFPNGRRLADDAIDIILTEINNGVPFGDHVDANDVASRDQFPFFAPSQQPRVAGTVDDNTRN
ncbi:hypothetical protein IMCC26134_09080 [Verrucomicrobia bacterium IMCC26134]|nr:hypothetical protein IMCC26134_09080 [Verrucomicrobia bacterium IMCC26134]